MTDLTNILLALILISIILNLLAKWTLLKSFKLNFAKLLDQLENQHKDLINRITADNSKSIENINQLFIDLSVHLKDGVNDLTNRIEAENSKLISKTETASSKLIDTLNEVTRLD
jgi:hypothetical protein